MSDDATLKILVDVQGRLDDLVRAQAEMRRLRIETAATGQAVRSGFGGLFSNMFGAGLAVNAVSKAVSAGLGLVTSSITEANGAFEKSRNLDITVQGYNKLRTVVRQSGGDVAALDAAISNLNEQLVKVGDGDDGARRLFESLRVDPVDLQAMSGEDRFVRLARAAKNSADVTGKSWSDLSDLIGGSRVMRRMRESLNELAENGFDSVSSSATEAEARGTTAIHSLFDAIEQNQATFKSKIVEDFGGFLGLVGFDNTAPKSREISASDMAGLRTVQQQRDALRALQLDLGNLSKQNDAIVNDPKFTDSQKKFWANAAASQAIKLFTLLEALRKVMPLDKQNVEERSAELEGYALTIKSLTQSAGAGPSAYSRVRDAFENTNVRPNANTSGNPNFLSAGEGAGAGVMSWATNLGSTGEQISAALQSTIGDTVHGISEGIYGWVTGANTFGEAMLNLGGTVLRTLIDQVTQMGVRWVITGGLAKATMTGIHFLGSMLRTKETTEVIASETAKKPALISNAVAANAGSFGMSALIGLLILTAIMAAFGGFEAGGYTGNGPTDAIAGVVHGQEGVLTAPAMRRLGVDNLARMNAGLPVNSGAVAFEGGAAGGGGGRDSGRNTHIYLDRSAWLDAVREDLSGIAHEIYDKRSRA